MKNINLKKISLNGSFLLARTINGMKYYSKDIKNIFIETMDICLKNILYQYFVVKNDYWNKSDDLMNLIQCNKNLYGLLEKSFKTNSQYMLSNISLLNKHKYPLIKHIIISNDDSMKSRKIFLSCLDLKTITFDNSFNQSLKTFNFPPNVIEMRFGSNFDKLINPKELPQTLKLLKFGSSFDPLNFLSLLTCQKGFLLYKNLKEIIICKEILDTKNFEYVNSLVTSISLFNESIKINFQPEPKKILYKWKIPYVNTVDFIVYF